MKYGRFITFPGMTGKEFEHPWTNMAKKFNSYEKTFEPGDGILTLKKEFSPEDGREISSVTVRATALGVFDMFINGNRITGNSDGVNTSDEMKPGWTDYRFRVQEFEYDITEYIQSENIFCAEVSPGWWAGRISFGFYKFQPTAFCGEIEIAYADGSNVIIASDTDWDSAVCGPVLRADIWDGEYYDATIPEPSIHPEAHKWSEAVLFEYSGKIVPAAGPRIRPDPDLYLKPLSAVIHNGTVDNGSPLGEIKILSKKVGDGCEKTLLSKGDSIILDFGQNMVGRPLILVNAARGTKISLYFAEMLNDSGDPNRGNDGPKGSMYIKNYRSALARVVYVAAGTGDTEFYFPTHSFFGFRYVEVRADGDVEIEGIVGEVLHSAVPETGDFFCDNAEVNRLYSNIVWGMRGNYFSAPTDCPQRDERLGWTGDTQVFCGAASYIGNIDSFMHKWLQDARDSQEGYEGTYCDVIPRVFDRIDANAAWGDAGVIVPHRLWEMYRDTDILNEHFESMEKYMNWLLTKGFDGPNTAYGDWLNYDITDKRYIAVCYYAYDAFIMSEMADAIGKADRAAYYRDLCEQIKANWAERYIKDGELTINTQTGYLLAIAFDLVKGEMYDKFVSRLKEKIVANDYTLSTGFVGTGILNKTLAKCGLDGLAYSLLLQTKDPSWLYSVRQGATTVWERWNSYTLKTGFGDVGMNSFNHYAYGAVAEWLYSGMCGILPDPDKKGFDHFVLRPTPDMRKPEEIPEGQKLIGMAHASYEASACLPGDSIESGWEKANGQFVYTFRIPEGLTARAELICGGKLNVNGLDCTPEEIGGSMAGGRAVFELSEGSYTIKIDE